MRSPLPGLSSIEKSVRSAWPGEPPRRFEVDEAGWSNLILEADGRWIIRVPRWRESARGLGFEIRLLEFLSTRLTLPIPAPEVIGTLAEPRGWPFFAYPRLPGSPLQHVTDLTRPEQVRLGVFLQKLGSELDSCPPGPLLKLGVTRGDPSSYAARFHRLRGRYRRFGAGRLASRLDRRISDTLDRIDSTLAESRYRAVLIHNDLWPSHILWDRDSRRPSAIIDWEDARLGDPVADLTAFAELPTRIQSAIGESRRQTRDTLFWQRLELYRRILPLWGYLFGVETRNRAIADQHLAELKGSLRDV